MNRVIKEYSKLPSSLRDKVYTRYSEGKVERTSFPFKGKIVDGVIYPFEGVIYLIAISTIVAGRSGSSDDLDDDDDDDTGIDTELESDEE